MKVFKEWEKLTKIPMNDEQTRAFWREYLDMETGFYRSFLEEENLTKSGTVENLANEYKIDTITFAGVLDGINDSLVSPLDLEELEAGTEITLEADREKLYYNMLDSKAKWLYELPIWETLLPKERRLAIRREYVDANTVTKETLPGRNEPCHCGSGKKYKNCHLREDATQTK